MIMVKVMEKKKFIIINMKNKKTRQYRSNQGRSPQRETDSMKVILYASIFFSFAAAILLIVELIW